MLYLVSYDIPSDKPGNSRRARIAKTMEAYGLRVQLSVFECELAPVQLNRLKHRIHEILNPDRDNVRIYPICSTCRHSIENHGKQDPMQRDLDCFYF